MSDYNQNIGEVDLPEFVLSFHNDKMQNEKILQKIFRHILDLVVLNSFICYGQLKGKLEKVECIIALAKA